MAQLIVYEWGQVLSQKINTLLKLPPDPDWPCCICPVPLFHVTASHHLFLSCFPSGRKLVLMTKWDATEALRLIEKERPTYWTGVPTMMQDLVEHPDFHKYDTSSLKTITGGGAAVPKAVIPKIDQRFKVGRPAQGYGLTETNGAIASISADSFVLRPGSTGKPFPIVEAKVVDVDTGEELKQGERGELVVRSPLVMKEYWGKPEATAKVLNNGWFKTGDVVYLDEENYIFIVDRAKDIIIRGGENISCADVENAILHHPAVLEAAVFGIPDERLGERVAAMIMLKSDAKQKPSANDIINFIKGHLASFKIPSPNDIFFTSQPLPRGATGKTLKREIKDAVLKSLKMKSKL